MSLNIIQIGNPMKKRIVKFIYFSLISLCVASLTSVAIAHQSTKQNSSLLFVQIAKSASLTPISKEANTYKLTLKNVEPFTSYFTDRPDRHTGLIRTHQFIKHWNHQKDYAQTPPNVAIESSILKSREHFNKIFELSNPIYDAKNNTVTYQAKLLDKSLLNKNTSSTPIMLGYVVLFIDDFHWDGNKFGH